MFRASSAHLQEDTVVHMQHMVLSLSMRVLAFSTTQLLEWVDCLVSPMKRTFRKFGRLNDEEAPIGTNLTERAILSPWSEFGNCPLVRSLLITRLQDSPLHVSSLKCSYSGGYSCTHAAYGTVTL